MMRLPVDVLNIWISWKEALESFAHPSEHYQELIASNGR